MGLESAIEKLDKYFKRLEKGKVQKIKPSHVDRVIQKLEAKVQLVQAELAETDKETKKQRLEQKLEMIREQQERANWLKSEIARA